MPRADQRRTSTDAAFWDIETAELLDRTGIIAASLPKRRRSTENVVEQVPVRNPVCEPVVDQDLRPKAVVIHRRAKSWLIGGTGAALLAIGWIAGSLTATSPAVEGIATSPRPVAADQPIAPRAPVVVQAAPQPAPQPAPQLAPQPAPVTVYVSVTVKQQAPPPQKRTPVTEEYEVLALPAQTRLPEQPHVDVNSIDVNSSDSRSDSRLPEALGEELRLLAGPAAQSIAERLIQEMLIYVGGR